MTQATPQKTSLILELTCDELMKTDNERPIYESLVCAATASSI
jgi:hypothetical protein